MQNTGAAAITAVVQSGYCKVLGKGELPKQPVVLKAKVFIRRAEEKMKGAGAAYVLLVEATQGGSHTYYHFPWKRGVASQSQPLSSVPAVLA